MDKSKKNEKEIKELDEWMKTNRDGRELKRALAVKLSLEGWTYEALAEQVRQLYRLTLKYVKNFCGGMERAFQSTRYRGIKVSI